MNKLKLFLNRFRHLYYRFLTKRKILTAVCRKYKLKFRFHINDGHGRDIYYKAGVYSEDYITSFLLKEINIQDNDLILDIGANIGWYSLVLSHKSKPQILAFEPDKFNFSLLEQNVRLNNKTNVRLFNTAIGNRNGILPFFLYKNYNLGRHSFVRQKNSIESTMVPVAVLDDLMSDQCLQHKRIKIIKIDIEGYEYSALLNATTTLRQTDNLLSEFSPQLMVQLDQDPWAFINLIRSTGFTILEISREGLTDPNLDEIISQGRQVNLFCQRK